MQTFLEQSAKYIYAAYQDRLDRITVVLPTNRACFFFKRALALQAEEPVWSPAILPIDDFISQTADAQLIDPIQLLWTLYDVCKATDPNVQFDRFTAWAYTLLQDFDRIDQYMIDTHQLFDYLSKAKTLERWRPDYLPNQMPKSPSAVMDQYFLLWENLEQIYKSLKVKLTEQRKAYRGMLYRSIAENPDILLDDPMMDKFIFVGLNALSTAEEKLLAKLVKEEKAELLWDSDRYYMDVNPEVKAGDSLRKYKKSEKFGPWNWQSDDMLTGSKDIYLIGVPNASMQGKVAAQLYQQHLQNEKVANESADEVLWGNHTAMVLPDENLLMPVLQSLGKEVADFNITMGLSLRNSSLFTLVNQLFELQYMTLSEKKKENKTVKFNHRHIIKVLTHPFVRQYEQVQLQAFTPSEENPNPPESLIQKIIHYISSYNRVFLSPKELLELGEQQPLFRTLFTPWFGEAAQALRCFYDLVDLLRVVYKNQKDAIETEYLFLFLSLIKRLDAVMKDRNAQPEAEKLSLRSFKLFLYELFKQTKIPFSGEPVSRLQIMGMLETRTLDFETVILLSANEKVLPLAKRQHSLIPFDACNQFGIPTYRSQEAIMSYHFYRLLQRPEKIYLLYVLPSDTYGADEKSRFLHQIENEWAQYNPNIRIHHQTVQVKESLTLDMPMDFRIEKSPGVLARIQQEFTDGLYPSQVNAFVQCSLKYYFGNVAKLREEEEIEESLGAGSFGELIHKSLESVDKELSEQNKPLHAEALQQVIMTLPQRVEAEFLKAYPGHDVNSGLNHLMYKIAVRVIRNFLTQQIKDSLFPMEILGLEKTLSAWTSVTVKGKPVQVKISGRIDRIDKVGNVIRVIDYKTGKVEKKQLRSGADTEELLLHDPEADKIRQLWLYKYILAKRMVQEKGLQLANRHLNADEYQLVSGIYSFRNIPEGLLEEPLLFEDTSLDSFVEQSEIYLQKMLERLLDPSQPFERTARLESCVYCAYKGICGR